MDMEERGAFVWSGEAYLCYSLSGLFVFGLIACCFLWFKRVLKRTRTGPEPEQEAREDAEFRQNKMPRLMQRERFREADWDVGSSSSSSRSCWQGNTNKKFEVFISHRGPDTKETLARHIYDLLRFRGVGVFLDLEELQAGEIFPEAIKEAIQCSRVHLCILSRRYTESVWCLKELEMMMHRYEIGASVIIPIFYDVKPFEVRHLKGAMGQGMEKQKQRYPSSKVEQWRDALRKIADISGYEGKGSIAKEVTARICQVLDVGSLAISNKVVGIWNQVEGLKDDITRLKEEGHDVTSVEITGIRGIGKTTFAKILYNKIHSGYTRSCFIEDVNGLVEKSGVNAVHEQISSDLFGYDPNLRESSAKQSLKSKLKDEEILIVLDNINKENCVSAVFIEDDVSLRATSTIIVTSTEQGVLQDDPDISRYRRNLIALQISKLPFEVSKELFCRYACEGSRCCFDPQQVDLMNKIISKCDGIPLALALFGKHVKHVYGKHVDGKHVDGKDELKDFWASIEHTLPSDITKILRFTYDHLDTDLEKCLFLDVAIFFRGETVELLRNIKGGSDEDDGKVSVALINLERKLLIDINFDRLIMHDRLNMHNVLVDLGRTIVMNESSCPGHRSRLWHPSDVRKVLSEERGTDKVKGLSLVWGGSAVLDEDENRNPCAWSADVFVGMSSMELLILEGSCIEGDFSKLSKKLLWLRWTNFPFEKIPRTLCIKRLRKLDLWDGQKMTHLWEHSPKEAPANLRKLDVHNCTKLQRLPEFNKKFKQLSSIVLDGCQSLEHIPNSFGDLQGLKHLELVSCVALQLLPETFGNLIKLQQFTAFGCGELKSLPSSFSGLPQISDIYIDFCPNLAIDEDRFEQITSLRALGLWRCKVPKLPWKVGQQNHLRTLSLCNDDRVSIWSPRNVPSLASFSETEVEELSLNTENLKDLYSLYLENISFTHLPVSMENLTALRQLRLCQCFNLRELPESVAKLPRLTLLKVEDCPRLRQLPSCTGNLSPLTELSVTGCCDLTELPESIGRLSSLEDLALDGCSSLQEVPLTIKNLSRLTNLSMNGCCNLKELPKSIDGLSSLEVLALDGCSSLQEVPLTIGNLSRLTNLSMNGCCNLKELPIDGLSRLVSLALNDCWSLREVSGIRNLSQLTVLSMKGCRHPRELPESVGRLSSLSSLALNDCLSLQKVPLDISNLSGLRYLYLTNCHDLRVLPESIGRVLSLGILFFHNCWNLQELPAAIGNLSNLSVYKCRNLRLLPMLEGCCPNMLKEPWQNFEDLPYYCWRMPYTVDNLPGTFTVTVLPDCYVCTKESPPRENLITLTRPKELPNLERLFVSGCMKNMMRHSCYKPPIPIDIIRQFHKLNRLSLSPSLGHGIDYNYENLEDFPTEKGAQCWFHFIGRTYSSSSISGHIIPNPKYSYTLSQSEKGECFRLSQGKKLLMCVQVEDFPEKVVVRKLHLTDKQSMAERGSIDDDEEFPGYTAVVQEGGVISLTPGNRSHEFFLREQKKHPLYSGFHVDIRSSPLRSIWKRIPIHIWGLSALDIANCNITNKYSHCSTCLMEEETGLTWKRRMRLFYDDHALELLRKESKFRHVAVSVSGCDLQTVADVCETCVSVVSYDQMGKSKVGQTYCINWTSSEMLPRYLRSFYLHEVASSTEEEAEEEVVGTGQTELP